MKKEKSLEQHRQEVKESQRRSRELEANPLSQYSTTQLKKELRRRRNMKMCKNCPWKNPETCGACKRDRERIKLDKEEKNERVRNVRKLYRDTQTNL